MMLKALSHFRILTKKNYFNNMKTFIPPLLFTFSPLCFTTICNYVNMENLISSTPPGLELRVSGICWDIQITVFFLDETQVKKNIRITVSIAIVFNSIKRKFTSSITIHFVYNIKGFCISNSWLVSSCCSQNH